MPTLAAEVTEKVHKDFHRQCRKEHRNVSQVLRMLVDDYLTKAKADKSTAKSASKSLKKSVRKKRTKKSTNIGSSDRS